MYITKVDTVDVYNMFLPKLEVNSSPRISEGSHETQTCESSSKRTPNVQKNECSLVQQRYSIATHE
jgi:hypothetical protein